MTEQTIAKAMTPETSASGREVIARLASIVAAIAACLLVLDIVLRIFLPATSLWRQQIDIQTPAALNAKLETLRRFDGTKIVIIGDSLAYGRTMRDHGDGQWQAHTLSSQLEQQLTSAMPGRRVQVMNLGMNGTLPVDLDHMVRVLTPLKPDLILFDLSLRSFSRDFASEADNQTRPWLAGLDISAAGTFTSTRFNRSVADRIRDFLVNHWYLYSLKDTLQAIAFDGQPAAYLMQVRNRLDGWLKRRPAALPASAEEDLLLMLKARARYARIDLASDNPQRGGLDRLLERLKASGQPALAFYATENVQRIEELVERPALDALHRQLAAAMSAGGDRVSYVGPLAIYAPANYLDHVHLDREGYRKLAQHLAPLITKALAQSRTVN